MNLFNCQSATQDEKLAKELMLMVVKKNVSKYIMAQKDIAIMLTTKKVVKKCKGKKKCTLCKLEAMLNFMADAQRTTSETCKTYKALFDEEVDLKGITETCKKEVLFGAKPRRSDVSMDISQGFIIPEDAPQDVKDLCATIKAALEKDGFAGAHMEVIDVSANNYGLREEDFEDFGSFAKAVSEARVANSNKSPEEMLTDAMIQNAENHVDENSKLN